MRLKKPVLFILSIDNRIKFNAVDIKNSTFIMKYMSPPCAI